METVPSQDIAGQFSAPGTSLGILDSAAAANLVSAAADIAFVIDAAGIVQDVSVRPDIFGDDCRQWIGLAFVDTVTVESRPKIQELLRESKAAESSRWRQVNHPARRGGADVPIRYTIVRAGPGGRLVALGRDLRAMAALQQRLVEAQLSMEREYSRLRHAETRYRLLFHIAAEAVLIVDAATNKIVEANPAASRVLGQDAASVFGRSILDLFDAAGAQAVQGILSRARASGRANGADAHILNSGRAVRIDASMFRHDSGSAFLVRLGESGDSVLTAREPEAESRLSQILGEFPEGFVLTGLDRRILMANQAFLDMAQLASKDHATGELLDSWLGRSNADLNVLIANLRAHGSVRNFPTVVRGQFGIAEDVQVSAVSAAQADEPCLGFVLRPQARRNAAEPGAARELPHSVEQLTELIGQVPLKELVRETTDVIERLCIEAALQLTGDNRASAAQMLGLSRQSLYVKLRRYGLADASEAEDV